MNILVIGNGFDIAHGLRTKYKHFLKFTDCFEQYYTKVIKGRENLGWDEDDESTEYYKFVGQKLKNYHSNLIIQKLADEFWNLTNDNKWIDHFKDREIEDGWVDFEKEISRIVKLLDDLRVKLLETGDNIYNTENGSDQTGLIIKTFNDQVRTNVIHLIDIKNTKERMLIDLNKLIRALEIYLQEYIGEMEISDNQLLDEIVSLKIDKLLSFNYTDTFEKFYGKNTSSLDCCYIHGKVRIDSNFEECNLVLGIDEYLKGDRKNEDNEFIEFKKFYQRIYKGTGDEYRRWIEQRDKLKNMSVGAHEDELNVYIYGHSLDVTDRDVLQVLINARGASTTIFYHTKEALKQQIANLVKVIGEKELIDRTGGSHKSIVFKRIDANGK